MSFRKMMKVIQIRMPLVLLKLGADTMEGGKRIDQATNRILTLKTEMLRTNSLTVLINE